ncbi:flagellar protein FlaG [Paenibacillus eucommiae]|uniref:Flagellar protein FlaG n=1 Tax=Paenibacillus eucommiae TaxID=1355755 RepID=A0ABS4IYH7_9BACL|nr:flagellar protein FlaG [Paenibacillus eucommiae]MBP1992649.1 flagellar protein FlaG [Paenibacillus eucommiae]
MSSNVSFGGIPSAGIQPLESISRVQPSSGESTAGTETSSIPLSIKTVKALKQAELRGENVTISEGQLIKAIDHALKAVQGATTSLEFSVHNKTKEIMVKVRDKETGDVIREIPPEKTLDFVAKLWEMAGILVDKKG